MTDIKLFRLQSAGTQEIQSTSAPVEQSLQVLIERHLESFLGIRFLATEYPTGKKHGGRIDTLGMDENGCPVIIEYKRSHDDTVINQGLFYMDWLLDHQAEFELLVRDRFSKAEAAKIDWLAPRLVCIAGDFSRYDEHAIQQINSNIELIRYRLYGNDLILFELANATTSRESGGLVAVRGSRHRKTVSDYLAQADEDMKDLFEMVRVFLSGLGDDVQMRVLKSYYAFKRIKNFACVELHPQSRNLHLFVKVNPDFADLEPGFTRDVRDIGHSGTGDLEITIRHQEDLDKARYLIMRSYEAN